MSITSNLFRNDKALGFFEHLVAQKRDPALRVALKIMAMKENIAQVEKIPCCFVAVSLSNLSPLRLFITHRKIEVFFQKHSNVVEGHDINVFEYALLLSNIEAAKLLVDKASKDDLIKALNLLHQCKAEIQEGIKNKLDQEDRDYLKQELFKVQGSITWLKSKIKLISISQS